MRHWLFGFSLCFTLVFHAQNSGCLSIESVLVDACGSPEGPNEMVRFRVGNSNLNTSNLFVNWPNNPYLGICQNSTTSAHVAFMNSTIVSCGYFLEPTGGVLPSGANVLLITSVDFDPTAHNYAGLTDTLYVIFQCAGNTAGHFANWISPCDPANGDRTVTLSFGPGCSASVTYNRCSLINQLGEIGGSTAERDGARVDFDLDGQPSYANDGCTIPYVPGSIQVNTSQNPVCLNSEVQVSAQVSGAEGGVQWTSNFGSFEDDQANQTGYTPTINSAHFIVVTTTNGCGESISDSVLITVVQHTDVSIQSEVSNGGCEAGDIQLTAIGSGEFIWNNGETTNVIFPGSSGIYSVVMSDLCGTSQAQVSVDFASLPSCGILQSGPIFICQGESVVLTAITDATEWSWNTGATSLSVTASTSGYYVFTGTTPCGQCADGIEVLVLNPSAQFSANPLSGPAPLTVDVVNTSQGSLTYQWLLDGEQLSGAFVPELVLEQAGQYELTLVVTDAQGCTNAVTTTILVFDEIQIEIPNVFTPNNDGSNDFFGVATSVSLPLNYNILNRWGNVVQTETLLTNDTQFTTLWDGKVGSAQATEGVYFYQFEFTFPSGETRNYSGFFNLVK